MFAGIGGFHGALSALGGECVYASEIDKDAARIYSRNWGLQPDGDITLAANEDNMEVPEHDVLVGGFPCQDYSVAKPLNKANGLEGKKGVLWWDIHRFLDSQKPKMAILENVDRLLKSPSSQRGRDFAVMLNTLGDEGYSIEWRVVNAAEYGFPQRRIRVFIIATKIKNFFGNFNHFFFG